MPLSFGFDHFLGARANFFAGKKLYSEIIWIKLVSLKSAIPSSLETFFPKITCSTNFVEQQPGS